MVTQLQGRGGGEQVNVHYDHYFTIYDVQSDCLETNTQITYLIIRPWSGDQGGEYPSHKEGPGWG